MAINKVWRVRDYHRNTITYFEKYPHVRKYFLENSKHHDLIVVEDIEWIYKSQLINLLNQSVSMGESLHLALLEQLGVEGETQEEFIESIHNMMSKRI